VELDSTGSGQETVVSSCKHGRENSGTVKGREFLGQLNDWQQWSP